MHTHTRRLKLTWQCEARLKRARGTGRPVFTRYPELPSYTTERDLIELAAFARAAT